jgi:GntR family transcriptional regulator, rspAB operon transcriptional repressor
VTLIQPMAAPNQGTSLSDEAYAQIRSMIISCELTPGSVISESDLMQKLEMGRTPIREALRNLANEKLIEVYPRRGMFVAGVDVKDLAQISEVRGNLEIQAAGLAAERATDSDRAVIAQLIKEIDAIKGEPKMEKLINLDQRIHHSIYAATQNEFLVSTLDQYYAHALRIWFMALDRVSDLEDAIIEHRAMLQSILDGDRAASEVAMREHIEGFETTIRKSL